ncbi:orexin receptor type 1-like [Acanthaster planci]|uniref:Orexin receptor type 1-like n=1 Tax=Acanthaster planci TaxID=133434 RepID=A0A8B7Y5S4_ACAPL|nr:orexin receptor type 1-like [Acanthaster planci]
MYLDSVWWFRVILESVVVIIGIPGNLLIIQVYTAKKNKVTPHIFIIGLTWADVSVCLLRIITLVQLFPPLDTLRSSNEFFCRVQPSIDAWPKYTSILLTSAVAVDRYLAICRPHGRRLTVRRARHVVLGCFAVSVLVTLSYLFTYGVVTLEDGSQACLFILPSAVISAQFIILMISFVASVILIVVLYIKIYRTVNRMAKVRPGNKVRREARQPTCRPSQDDSTAIAEGITPKQLKTLTSGTNREIPKVKPAYDPEDRRSPPQPEQGNPRHKGVTKLAWTGDQQEMKELPILDPLPKTTAPSTSALNATRDNPSSTVPGAHSTAADETNRPTAQTFHKRTTLMLLLSTVVFVVTLLPLCIILTLYPLIVPFLQNQTVRFCVNVASYLNVINNAANPILFSYVNRKFREEMKRSLRKLCCQGCRFRN